MKTATPDLRIRIKKNADGTSSMSCTRADGTVTWQSPKGAQGRFFAGHDLTHFAVETALGEPHAFFGLLADGWNITDFAPPWPRGPLPAAAAWIELMVGFLDTERASATQWTAEDFNDKARIYHADHGGVPYATIDDAQLDRIRERRRELFAEWAAVAIGDAMELVYQR